MQDEVTKHGRKIYHIMKNSQHTFGERVKEIIIEICIIVFAVTLSIWFHSWSEHRHEQEEVSEFLRGLKDDLNNDLKLLENNKNIITTLDSNFHFILSVKKGSNADKHTDTVISKYFKFEIPETHPNIGRYEGFKSSGKIGTIKNDSLKQHILVYYQQIIPDLVSGENYINSLQLKILDLAIDRMDKTSITDFVTSRKMQVMFGLGVHNFELSIDAYNKASEQIKKIIAEIDKEAKG
jgi:hypothetical protein